jgi:GNAT superfamily N-acetyltransferase
LPVEVREIDSTTAPLLAAAMGPEGDLVETRLERGCRCFGAWLDGELAGYAWLSTRPEWIGELELEIAPRPAEAYIWNCVTLPAHRRRGVFRALLIRIRAGAVEDGLRRLWIGSVAIPAEKVFGQAGFKRGLVFQNLSFGRFRWMSAQDAPGADPALVTDAIYVLGLRLVLGKTLRMSHPRRH